MPSYPKIDEESIDLIERFLKQVPVVESAPRINADAIELHRKGGLEIPDALIAASARFIGSRLLTADNDFKKVEEDIDQLLWKR